MADIIKNGVNRVAETLNIFRKDVFDMEGVPAFRQFYMLYVWPWKYVYKGFYDAWHTVPAISIAHPKGNTRRLATVNAGKMAAAQLARYEWTEHCDITATRNGEEDADTDPLNEYIHHVLTENGFWTAFGDLLEKANALGGGAIKEWCEVPKDRNGNDMGEPRVRLSYHMADQFIPTRWTNGKVTDAMFVSREAKDGYYYSIVEWHRWAGETYRVTNELYRVPIKDTAEPQNILGWWYPLNAIYPLLSPATDLPVTRTMFQYIRPFGANFADDNSPLGVSVYASAMDTLHALDVCFDSFQREFLLGRKRIIVPARAIRTVTSPSGAQVRYFDANDEVYEALATDDTDSLNIKDNSVELRVEEHVAAMNALLSILCTQVGFDPGALSFDRNGGLKTATEVVSENSRTYSTVCANTAILTTALEDMVRSIIELASAYGVTWKGTLVSELAAGGFNVSVRFDDGIIQDRQTNINEGIMLVNNGLQSKYTFLTDTMGLTPEQAAAEIKRIKEEQAIGPEVIDKLDGFGA